MNNRSRISHSGMIVFLAVLLGAVWFLSVYETYEGGKRDKSVTSAKPGAVTYGTHSAVSAPVVSVVQYRHTIPMISGSAIRSYAYHGHAAYTVHHTPYTVHTTSSARVGNTGFGGVSGGAVTAAFPSVSAHASAGGNPSVTLSVWAMASSAQTSASLSPAAPARMGDMRRMPGITEDTGEGDEATDGDGHWYFDGENWVLLELGATKIEGGNTYRWDGSAWVLVTDQQDPGLPLGDAPWLWMVFLAIGYVVVRQKRIAR